jgi:hypothetical protein
MLSHQHLRPKWLDYDDIPAVERELIAQGTERTRRLKASAGRWCCLLRMLI